jgi:hypothetical protein
MNMSSTIIDGVIDKFSQQFNIEAPFSILSNLIGWQQNTIE